MSIPAIIAALFALVQYETLACPVCWGGSIEPTLAESVMGAEAVLIVDGEPGETVIKEVLKGEGFEVGDPIRVYREYDYVGIRFAIKRPDDQRLAAHGPPDDEVLEFVKMMLPLQPLDVASDRVWHKRLDLMQPYLGHSDERLAKSAWAIWAQAPYRVLASRENIPPLDTIRSWLADDDRSYEDNLLWTLLGVYGEAEDHAMIEKTLEQRWKNKDTDGLPALIGARIAHSGKEAVASIYPKYLLGEERTLKEMQDAVLALGLHGAQTKELRKPITDAFLEFVEKRPHYSGLVANDLAAWGVWDAQELYSKYLESAETLLPGTAPIIKKYVDAAAEKAR